MSDLPTGVPSRAHEIVVTCIVCSIITTVFVLTRLYTRCFINRSMGWDDYVALLTLPFCIAYSSLIGASTLHGMGLHQKDLTAANLQEQYYLWIAIASEFYVLSLMGYRFAIMLLYLRIYGINRRFRYCVYATMFLVFGYLLSNLLTEFLGCTPVQKTWKSKLPGHCIDGIKADYGYGTLHCLSDLIIFVLPIPMIWMTQLKLREKIGIMIIFMFGSLNFVVSIVRFIAAVQDLTAEDRSWLAAKTFLLSVIEVNTGLICACVPVLKPAYKSLVYKTQSLTDSWSHSHSRTRIGTGKDGKTYMSDQTVSVSETALTDLENGKVAVDLTHATEWDDRKDSSASTAKNHSQSHHPNHDRDNGKYGADVADV